MVSYFERVAKNQWIHIRIRCVCLLALLPLSESGVRDNERRMPRSLSPGLNPYPSVQEGERSRCDVLRFFLRDLVTVRVGLQRAPP